MQQKSYCKKLHFSPRPLKRLKCICHHKESGKEARGFSSSGRWSLSLYGWLKAQMPFTGWVVSEGRDGFSSWMYQERSADMKSYLSSTYTDLVCPLWKVIYTTVWVNTQLFSYFEAFKATKAGERLRLPGGGATRHLQSWLWYINWG